MNSEARLEYLKGLLKHRSTLLVSGLSDWQIHASLSRGELYRVSPGWFVGAKEWSTLREGDKHLLLAVCVHAEAQDAPVFSGCTAALMLGLPLFGAVPSRVQVTVPAASNRCSSGNVTRHRADCLVEEIVMTAGLRHTELTRTLLDVARVESFERAIVVGDAALRRLVKSQEASVGRCKEELLSRLSVMKSSRGRNRARRVIEFLDAAMESPLESLFRLQLARLGFEVQSQVQVKLPDGRRYRMDFELTEFGVFLEADGRVKYTNEQMRNGRSVEDVVLEERHRENLVSGATAKRIIRGRWADAMSPDATARLLRGYNIEPPIGRSGRLKADLC